MTDEDKKFIARRYGVAYLLFSLGNSYIEECNDLIAEGGHKIKHLKTKANNLMQSFDAYDKVMSAIFREKPDDSMIKAYEICQREFDELLQTK